jgi:hypothetical protein
LAQRIGDGREGIRSYDKRIAVRWALAYGVKELAEWTSLVIMTPAKLVIVHDREDSLWWFLMHRR